MNFLISDFTFSSIGLVEAITMNDMLSEMVTSGIREECLMETAFGNWDCLFSVSFVSLSRCHSWLMWNVWVVFQRQLITSTFLDSCRKVSPRSKRSTFNLSLDLLHFELFVQYEGINTTSHEGVLCPPICRIEFGVMNHNSPHACWTTRRTPATRLMDESLELRFAMPVTELSLMASFELFVH